MILELLDKLGRQVVKVLKVLLEILVLKVI